MPLPCVWTAKVKDRTSTSIYEIPPSGQIQQNPSVYNRRYIKTMFHMLGRFAFTSSFSRRSSPGLPTGETRFGSCCCENGPLSVFIISYQSIHYSQFKAATSTTRSPDSRTDPRTVPWRCSASLIWAVLAPIICFFGARRFRSPSPDPSRHASCWRRFASLVDGPSHVSPEAKMRHVA